MQPKFEHFYQERYLLLSWPENSVMSSENDVMELRTHWTASLSGWHSPYKALIDASNLRLDVPAEKREAFRQSFERTMRLLQGFFLQKAAVFGLDKQNADLVPFPLYTSEDEARDALNINRQRKEKVPQSFREAIQFQNHFRQHVMEISFSQDVIIDDKEKVSILKSKVTNNLMQWHSGWNLLIDCQNLEVAADLDEEFQQMFRFFQGFFMKKVIGYSPKRRGMFYPFEVVLARHRAAAQLEAEGLFSGDDANCKSRRS
ncbi:MAG: hypothetical protein ACOH5I_24850 [Oligoflexus sp.]